MELIFNKDGNGKEEIKDLLGFIDADIDFENLITDIELITPYLIRFIGKATYELALYTYDPLLVDDTYQPPQLEEAQEKAMERCVRFIQLYIAILANNQFEQSSDLLHTNSGRKVNKTGDQVTPWEWQINKDNAAQMKKAYQALDHLLELLDTAKIPTWINSEIYKEARSIFLYNTRIFDDSYPINESGQLYYKMVSFMSDIELEEIYPILGKEKFRALKAADAAQETSEDEEERLLLRYIRAAVAYFTMAKAYMLFPIEMFPDKVNYQENTTMKSKAKIELVQSLKKDAHEYLLKIENQYKKMNSVFTEQDPMIGLQDDTKHVSL